MEDYQGELAGYEGYGRGDDYANGGFDVMGNGFNDADSAKKSEKKVIVSIIL